MSNKIINELSNIDEAYIQEVFDYKKSERSKFTMSKKKLFRLPTILGKSCIYQ